ncbi:hypothetical protein JL108_02475 [Aeromicrobium sp. YIM 150415]|uniref:hypothetical protein n=1 Tax=Aeromicrobium sp. YIM 150415 TaxID=2803912 RepID=UPI001965287D|nr:hypothetical protein [Aeromicrobium sp. YIM 150415]MBM9462296.1 hypothetical protein [Aeromicrobium sp. YIM 150415]
MTEAQTWTLIATFITAFFGTLTLFGVMVTRLIRAEIGGVRAEMSGLATGLRAEMSGLATGLRGEVSGLADALRADMGVMETRLNAKFDALDRDVQAIARRVFPDAG